MLKYILLIWVLMSGVSNAATPILNFSDLIAGPKTGNTDGVGSGAIVTLWGNNLGSSQGTSKVYVGDVEATAIYYWKDADGQLPGGPSDLKTYHKMQEVCFAVPATSVDGANTIKVVVGGTTSNELPFTVRSGNIRFVKSGGSDTGAGTWSNPWASIPYIGTGAGGVLASGDIVYSVGVDTTSGLVINNGVDDYGIIAYPNTQVEFSGHGQGGYVVYNYGTNPSESLVFSKIKTTCDTTGSSGFSPSRNARWIGLEITGPTAYNGMSGAIGGSASEQAGGGSLLGLYVHHYGVDNDVPTAGNVSSETYGVSWSQLQHLFYLSQRSSTVHVDGYTIAWGHYTDNPMYQGIHIYDMNTTLGWDSPLYIHDNVVKNQRGNAINVDLPNTTCNAIYIYNNIAISDSSDVYNSSAIRINSTCSGQPIYVLNNTFYGYNVQNSISGTGIIYRNNAMVDTKGVTFMQYAPATHSNNIFYSGVSTSQPIWASSESGNVIGNPLFTNATLYDFSLQLTSPLINAGYDISSIVQSDFVGTTRGSVDIGAFEYVNVSSLPSIVPTSFRAPGGAPYGIVQ